MTAHHARAIGLAAVLIGISAACTETPVREGWFGYLQQDQMDDSYRISLDLKAAGEVAEDAYRPNLHIRCDKGRTQVYVDTGNLLSLTAQDVDVRVRFDRTDPVTGRWAISEQSRLVSRDAEVLAARLLNAAVMRFEYQPIVLNTPLTQDSRCLAWEIKWRS